MLDHLQKYFRALLTPLARLLHRLGVGPDAVTIGGTIVAVGLAMGLLPTGHVFLGGVLIGVFALFDTLDGTLARLSGRLDQRGARRGHAIAGLDQSGAIAASGHPDVYVYHAGTRQEDGTYYTDGGRVLGITATGETQAGA